MALIVKVLEDGSVGKLGIVKESGHVGHLSKSTNKNEMDRLRKVNEKELKVGTPYPTLQRADVNQVGPTAGAKSTFSSSDESIIPKQTQADGKDAHIPLHTDTMPAGATGANARSSADESIIPQKEINAKTINANSHIASGLVGGTLNSIDEDGSFNPEKFAAGFIAGLAGSKAVAIAARKMTPQLYNKILGVAKKMPQMAKDNPKLLGKLYANGKDVSLNSFAGEKAITANVGKLDQAKAMLENGADEVEIWQKTGWFKDKDGAWKFEIGDSKARLNPNFKSGGRLSELLEHEELFKAYPELKDISVKKISDDIPDGAALSVKNTAQKEKRGIYNVTYNDKSATLVRRDLEKIDDALMFEKGSNKKGGAIHIKKHLEPEAQGAITQSELLNIGKNIREYLKKYKEPFIDEHGGRIYEWANKEGVKFRVVVYEKTDGISASHPETIISFYSNRNLKKPMEFRNPEVKYDVNLRQWHKDSAPITKNTDGSPKVFYHGSNEGGLSVFKRQPEGSGYGFWFTASQKQANEYASAELIPSYLKITKPFEIEKINDYDTLKNILGLSEKAFKEFQTERQIWRKAMEKLRVHGFRIADKDHLGFMLYDKNGEYVQTPNQMLVHDVHTLRDASNDELAHFVYDKYYDRYVTGEVDVLAAILNKNDYDVGKNFLRNKLKKAGYDGIKIDDNVIVVFDSAQIKHVKNNGNFSDNPNIYKSDGIGYYDPRKKEIALSDLGDKSTLMHEVQHAIQEIEGFAKGSGEKGESYRLSHGEAEARNVQSRLNLDDAARTHPHETFDVNPNETFVSREGGVSFSVKDALQKERRGVYNVAFNEKKSTIIRKDLDAIDEIIKFEKGEADYVVNGERKNGYGALHIQKHLDTKNNGWVTKQEYLNMGQMLRKSTMQEADDKRIYTYFNDEGIRFRLVIGASKNKERVISFYSNRKPLKAGLSYNSQNYDGNLPLNDDIIAQNGTKGYYSPANNEIGLSDLGDKSTLMHEVQHAIQEIEGFAKGSGAKGENYRLSHGEAEARNVQNRLNLGDKFRAKIVKDNNPVGDDYHAWIRGENDIKTFKQAYDDDGGGDLAPDFTEAMAKKAIDSGEITVYSSKPIKAGSFVTPSKMEAKSYAGSGKIYEEKLNLNDISWIDALQGQVTRNKDIHPYETFDVNPNETIISKDGMINLSKELEKKYILKDGSINEAAVRKEAELFIEKEYSLENFKAEFPNGKVDTPIGEVAVSNYQFEKLNFKGREKYLGLIKPTLERPAFVVDFEDTTFFFKPFRDKDGVVKFASVIKERDGGLDVTSNYPMANRKFELITREGKIRYVQGSVAKPVEHSLDNNVRSSGDIKSLEHSSDGKDIIPQNEEKIYHSRKIEEIKQEHPNVEKELDESIAAMRKESFNSSNFKDDLISKIGAKEITTKQLGKSVDLSDKQLAVLKNDIKNADFKVISDSKIYFDKMGRDGDKKRFFIDIAEDGKVRVDGYSKKGIDTIPVRQSALEELAGVGDRARLKNMSFEVKAAYFNELDPIKKEAILKTAELNKLKKAAQSGDKVAVAKFEEFKARNLDENGNIKDGLSLC